MLSCQACAAVTAPFSQGMASQVEQDLRGLCRQRVTCEPERLKTDATFTSPLCYIHFSFVCFAERSQVFHASSSQVRPAPDLSSPLQSKVNTYLVSLCHSQHIHIGFAVLTELEAAGGLTVMPCFYTKVIGKPSSNSETDPASNCTAVFLVKENKNPSIAIDRMA